MVILNMFDMIGGTATVYVNVIGPDHTVQLNRIEKAVENLKAGLALSHAELLAEGKKIMSAISDFAAKVETDFTALATGVDGVVADVDSLKAQIQALQDSQGKLTPEDQDLLDGIQTKVAAIAAKMTALDAATETAPTP